MESSRDISTVSLDFCVAYMFESLVISNSATMYMYERKSEIIINAFFSDTMLLSNTGVCNFTYQSSPLQLPILHSFFSIRKFPCKRKYSRELTATPPPPHDKFQTQNASNLVWFLTWFTPLGKVQHERLKYL